MNILLCDDDSNFLTEFEKNFSDLNCHIYKYTSKEAVLNSDVVFDMAFLDIVLDNDSLVFSVIDCLRLKNPKCVISFVTNHIKYAPEGYEYKAFRYILKNEPALLIKRRINDALAEYRRRSTFIKGNYKGNCFSVSPSEIYYIEILNHILKLYTSKGQLEMYNKLKDIYPILVENGFIRCHRSYIVNLNFVRFVGKENKFILYTPEEVKVPIGIRYKEQVKEKYLNYAGEML
ncbi:MAG: response regulator transcription factor [Clostridia bacterium]|nr:response regulator transcription factor [Clostridia bacterium]